MIKMPKGRTKAHQPNQEILFQTLALYTGITSTALRLTIAKAITSENGINIKEIRAENIGSYTSISRILGEFNLLGATIKKGKRYTATAWAEYALATVEVLGEKITKTDQPTTHIIEASAYPAEIRAEILKYLSSETSRESEEKARQSFYAASSLLRYAALQIILDSDHITFSDLSKMLSQKNMNVPASTQSNMLTSFRNAGIISENAEYLITPTGEHVISSIRGLEKLIGEDFITEKTQALARANPPVETVAAYEAILRSYFNLTK